VRTCHAEYSGASCGGSAEDQSGAGRLVGVCAAFADGGGEGRGAVGWDPQAVSPRPCHAERSEGSRRQPSAHVYVTLSGAKGLAASLP